VALLPIRLAGDPVLRQKAKKVRQIDASIQKLIDDMIETMRDAPGVGLAANQVGVPLRVIVIEVPKDEDSAEGGQRPEGWDLYVLVNPQIVKRSGERHLDEGCLSVPGYKAVVPRSVSVTAKGLNREGREVRIKAEDNLLAEALEHEIDHINGVLYIDHLESMDELVRLDEDEDGDEDQDETSREDPAPPARADRTREVKARPARARS
jgi:peptide deformylase